jgi:hypothetical protein
MQALGRGTNGAAAGDFIDVAQESQMVHGLVISTSDAKTATQAA